MSPDHTRALYIVCAVLVGLAILGAMELLWRMRGSPSSRRIPGVVHASLLAFCAASFATAALYWAMPYLRLPGQQFPSVLVNIIRIRDGLLGVGVALDVAGILLMAWPRKTPRSGHRRSAVPRPPAASMAEVMSMPGGGPEVHRHQPPPQLNLAPVDLPP